MRPALPKPSLIFDLFFVGGVVLLLLSCLFVVLDCEQMAISLPLCWFFESFPVVSLLLFVVFVWFTLLVKLFYHFVFWSCVMLFLSFLIGVYLWRFLFWFGVFFFGSRHFMILAVSEPNFKKAPKTNIKSF